MTLSLFDLSLRGSLAFLLVWVVDQVLARTMSTRWRRIWWLLIPIAFLGPVRFSILPTPVSTPVQNAFHDYVRKDIAPLTASWTVMRQGQFNETIVPWISLLWLGGMAVSSALVIVPTFRVQRQWAQVRLSTDTRLLDLLEDCKGIARVTAPIGLIVSDKIPTPVLLGWLRPRVLLPSDLAAAGSESELKAVLLHELAHFKMLDIPFNWLFTAARIVHWFNPLVHVAGTAWARFREEAADENAIHWMKEPTGTAYGEILLKLLGNGNRGDTPYGALAIGESIQTLKRRILMIRHYTGKSNRGWLASAIILALGTVMALSPSWATAADDDSATAKKNAVAAMEPWLTEIDNGSYAKSWSDASKSFQKALTSDQWVAALTSVRTPLDKSIDRKLASVLYQTSVPLPNGKSLNGKFVIAQFDSSFTNLKDAVETLCFEQEPDGVWRASGYYIKPRL